jgi:L-fuculose-phosphate aldolase
MKYDKYTQLIVQTAQDMAKSSLVRGTWGNVSIRIKDENAMAITPSGVNYFTMEPKDVVVVDYNGNIIHGNLKPSIEINLHSEIYKNRKDINAIVHTHSDYCTAFAIARKEIPAAAEDLIQIVGGNVKVADYALPGTIELAQNTLKALENRNAVLMANHGLVAAANDISEALKIAYIVEKAAKASIMAHILGGVVELKEEYQIAMRDFYLNIYGQNKNE